MLRYVWIVLVAVFFQFPAIAGAAETSRPDSATANTWREILAELRRAANLVRERNLPEAQSLLEKLAETSPQPYNRHAKSLAWRIPHTFTDHDYVNSVQRRVYQQRAEIFEQLGDYATAGEWMKRASDLLEPSARGNDLQHRAWLLAAAGRADAAAAQYDQAVEAGAAGDPFSSEPIAQQIQKQKEHLAAAARPPDNVQAQLEFIRDHFLKGLPHDCKPDRLLSALERLTPLLEKSNAGEDRKQVYGQIQACLLALGDLAGLTLWEDQMLGEEWVSLEDRAGVAAQRADRAYKFKNHAEAEKQWRLICGQFPHTSHFGLAQFNLGYVLQEQGKFAEAIEEYNKLFPSQVNDKDPGSNIMEAYRNYRNRGAKQISQCYDKLGKPREALEWAILARDKYRYESWCGTCSQQESAATAANLVRLKRKAGDTAEALRDAEALVFNKEHFVHAIHVPQLIAEEYFEQGRAQELLDRVEKFRRENLDKRASAKRRNDSDRPFDGHTDASRLIADYIEVLQLAEQRDLASLWVWIQSKQVSAQQAMMPKDFSEGLVGLAVFQLVSDRATSIDYLKGRFRTGNDVERAWAAVLLAKLGEVKNAEALHRLAAAVDDGLEADRVRTDFLYAVLVADPTAGKTLVDRYIQTDLSGPAQNAYFRDRNMTLLATE